MATHLHTCPLCEAMCGLVIEHEDGEVLSIRGDTQDPLSRGHICPKAVALQDLYTDPDRLRRPHVRDGEGWREVDWDEGLDAAAARIRAVQNEHGMGAVAIYLGNPTVHNYAATLYALYLTRALRTKKRFSATSVDQLPHHFAAFFVLGNQLLLPIPDLERVQTLVIMGGNPAASNGSIMSAPDVRKRLRAISERGGRVVLIDPRKTETATVVDEHHFIRPGSDALLLMAMVNVLFEEERVDLGHLAEFTDGVEQVRELCRGFTPENTAPHTGIAPEIARDLARALSTDKAALYGRLGVSTQAFGGLCQWLLLVINALTGNLDRPGGMMFTTPAVDAVAGVLGVEQRGSFGRWTSPVSGRKEFGGELPVSTLAQEIEAGAIKALITFAGNPALSTPDGGRLDRALHQLDALVCIDPHLGETSRHAHVVLPPVSPLQRDHFDLVFNVFAIRNYARYSEPLFPPEADQRRDWQILIELESRLCRRGLSTRMERAVRWRLGPKGLLDLALRSGPHGAGWLGMGSGLTLKRLKEHEHGLDLGPLQSRLPERLFTADKRIRLAPPEIVSDVPRLRAQLDVEPPESLVLIGRRSLRSNNSWMHNSERLVRGKHRCTLMIHPDDARIRGLKDGSSARIRSRVGQVEAPVELTDSLMPGVVSLPHGWGHGRQGSRLSVAGQRPGVSVNTLTDGTVVDELSGNAVLSGVPVDVEAV